MPPIRFPHATTASSLPRRLRRRLRQLHRGIALKEKGLWLKTEQYSHNYPHCWRTDTPLIYKAVPSWYVEVTKIKDRMVELNSGKPIFNKQKLPLTLETARLKGEIVSEKYFHEIAAMFSCEEGRRYFYFCHNKFLDEDQTHDAIKCWQYRLNKGLPRFAFVDQNNNFIGIGGFAFYNPSQENFENGRVEISYQLDKTHWNQGFATEITKALIEYAFKYYPVDEVCAATVSDNFASQRVLEKSGFKLVRQGKNSYPKDDIGTQYEEYYYELKRPQSGINWIPDHIKNGQFGKWLEGARDWSITRNRFWGCPVPVWRSESGKIKVFGSIAEIEKARGKK